LILVDTSIWVDHFRTRLGALDALIAADQVLGHPFVTGELAVGDLSGWKETVSLLRAIPAAPVASEQEFLDLLLDEGLIASGLGFVDVHLLASCRIKPEILIWSRDKRLAAHAGRMNLAWEP